jgi:cytochrome b6-f complex subunit 4
MKELLVVVKLPFLTSSKLCSKLSKGLGNNAYGEPAWPNDILFLFPVVILGVTTSVIGLSISEPISLGEPATPFATPLDILPEWYFYQAFNLLRILPNKLLGLLAQIYVPAITLLTPLVENTSRYQNPFRRPICSGLAMCIIGDSLWLGLGSVSPIPLALPFW